MTFRNVILIPLSCFWLVSEGYATKLSPDDSTRKKSLKHLFGLDFFFGCGAKTISAKGKFTILKC